MCLITKLSNSVVNKVSVGVWRASVGSEGSVFDTYINFVDDRIGELRDKSNVDGFLNFLKGAGGLHQGLLEIDFLVVSDREE